MATNREIMFQNDQDVWVVQPDGSWRAARYVGRGAAATWFEGAPTVIVLYPDTASSESVEVDQVIARRERADLERATREHRPWPR